MFVEALFSAGRQEEEPQVLIPNIIGSGRGCQTELPFKLMSNQIKTISVALNGEPRQVPEGLTIATFLAHVGLPADRVAVELNRQIVRKTDWESTTISNEAQLEVVHFVGGGR